MPLIKTIKHEFRPTTTISREKITKEINNLLGIKILPLDKRLTNELCQEIVNDWSEFTQEVEFGSQGGEEEPWTEKLKEVFSKELLALIKAKIVKKIQLNHELYYPTDEKFIEVNMANIQDLAIKFGLVDTSNFKEHYYDILITIVENEH